MSEPAYGPLRLWEGSRPHVARGPAPPPLLDPPEQERAALLELGQALASQEMLRWPRTRAHDLIEPLSLQWFLELEQVRHTRQGRWIPLLLEFGKHQGERLLGLGAGLGSDLVQYARHGAEVVAASPSAEQLALVRRNFELRGLTGTFLHAMPSTLPIEPASIDVACVMGLLHETNEPARVIDEVYRVLKPGGKVVAVVPARYDVEYWSRLFFLSPRPKAEPEANRRVPLGLLARSGRQYQSGELRQLFHRFHESRIYKRHLRRAEVPHLWRWMPLSLLERLGGRLLVFKGFKPVSAARGMEQAAA